jgi:hypothetical protein
MQVALNPCPQVSTKVDIATRSGGANLCLGIEAISPESCPDFPARLWVHSRLFVSRQHSCQIDGTVGSKRR